MFQNVVVGVDGRSGGRDAVALATKLTARAGKLTLAHVYPYPGDPPVRGYDEEEAEQIRRARPLLEAAAGHGKVDAQLRWIGASSPGCGLRQIAETVDADLLVVGSTRRGPLGRVLIGDDTRGALDGAPCAVAIAPAGYAHAAPGIRKVGVGYDGSPDSERALATGRSLAAQLGAQLAALEVVFFPSRTFGEPIADDAARIEHLVSRARERVASLGDDLEPYAMAGDAAKKLSVWSASLDLLVVGSRAYGPIGRLVHGSTSRDLTRHAQCSLLVLPRVAQARDSVEGFVPARGSAPLGAQR